MKDNNQDQQPKSENQEKENVRMVSSPEEFFAILEGHAIKTTENGETKYFYLKPEEKIEVAHQIATMYLQQHPRRPNTGEDTGRKERRRPQSYQNHQCTCHWHTTCLNLI